MEKKKLNISVNEGGEFFSHELSVNYTPIQFVLDFKSITPRVDMRSRDGPMINIKHNVILADPYHVVMMHRLMGDMIKKYESDFGKIKKPKALEIAEKKNKEEREKFEKMEVPDNTPSYMG